MEDRVISETPQMSVVPTAIAAEIRMIALEADSEHTLKDLRAFWCKDRWTCHRDAIISLIDELLELEGVSDS